MELAGWINGAKGRMLDSTWERHHAPRSACLRGGELGISITHAATQGTAVNVCYSEA